MILLKYQKQARKTFAPRGWPLKISACSDDAIPHFLEDFSCSLRRNIGVCLLGGSLSLGRSSFYCLLKFFLLHLLFFLNGVLVLLLHVFGTLLHLLHARLVLLITLLT